MRAGRMGRLRNRVAGDWWPLDEHSGTVSTYPPLEGKKERHRITKPERWFDQPIDQTNGGLPPGEGFRCTAMWRPQPAARPSNNPSSTLAQAG